MSATDKRLRSVYKNARVIPFDKQSKFIIMSDCHRGQGNMGDNFMPNQMLFMGALEHYYQNGFTYIELGDGDELWENRRMNHIVEAHNDVFSLMTSFYMENRLYLLYGNHDIVKKRSMSSKREICRYYCENHQCVMPLFPGVKIAEGLILNHTENGRTIFLVHGHQGSLINDTFWQLGRFLVRYFWRPLEIIGFTAPTGAARSHTKKEKIERELANYANSNRQMLIAGHTHRPVCPSPGEGLYFNDGSSVHPHGITGIEIENDKITLIKWSIGTRDDMSLYTQRQVLEGPYDILSFYAD